MKPTYDKETIALIDDLKHQLKSRAKDDQIAEALNDALNDIINRFVLDTDPHAFAVVPESLPDPIRAVKTLSPESYQKFANAIFEWIPRQPCSISAFIRRCENNAIEKSNSTHFASDIKSALLSLKAEGRIKMEDGIILSKKETVL